MSRKRSFNVENFLATEFVRYSRRFDSSVFNYDLSSFKEVIDVEAIQKFVDKDIYSHSLEGSSIARRKHKKRLSHLTRIFSYEISRREIKQEIVDKDVVIEVHLALKSMACSVYPCIKKQGDRIHE